MRILIAGDNHLDYDIILALNERYKDFDLKLHTGDSQFDLLEIEQLKNWKKVRGNNDFISEEILPKYIIIPTEYGNIFLTHGHLYRVKSDTDKEFLISEAKRFNCKFVVYGHTHVLDIRKVDDMIVINPNSIRLPIMPRQKSYVELHLCKSSVKVLIMDYDFNKIGEYEF